MTWSIIVLIGLGTGAIGAGAGWFLKPKETELKVLSEVVKIERELVTDADILKEVCSAKFIIEMKQGSGLCRLLWCRSHTRNSQGTAQSATSKECEAVSNLENKKAMIRICSDLVKDEAEKDKKFDECINLFDRRI